MKLFKRPKSSDIIKDDIELIMKDLRELKHKKSVLQKNADEEIRKSMSQKGEYGNGSRVNQNLAPFRKESERLSKVIKEKEKELSRAQNRLSRVSNIEKRSSLDMYKESEIDEKEKSNMSVVINKYTNEDIDNAKLLICEACRTGKITESKKMSMLEELDDAVIEYNSILESADFEEVDADDFNTEVVEESTSDDTDNEYVKLLIYESCRQGDITPEERDEILADL